MYRYLFLSNGLVNLLGLCSGRFVAVAFFLGSLYWRAISVRSSAFPLGFKPRVPRRSSFSLDHPFICMHIKIVAADETQPRDAMFSLACELRVHVHEHR